MASLPAPDSAIKSIIDLFKINPLSYLLHIIIPIIFNIVYTIFWIVKAYYFFLNVYTTQPQLPASHNHIPITDLKFTNILPLTLSIINIYEIILVCCLVNIIQPHLYDLIFLIVVF